MKGFFVIFQILFFNHYTYAYLNAKNKVKKSTVLLSDVENVQYNKYDTNLVEDKLFTDLGPIVITEEPVKSYQYSFALGLNVSNILEFNAPTGPDKNSFSATSALDLGLDYYKEGSRFVMTNELHWTLGIQKTEFPAVTAFKGLQMILLP